jgi:hypothetical protein
VITCQPYYAFEPHETEKVEAAARQFANFLNLPAVVKIKEPILNSPI